MSDRKSQLITICLDRSELGTAAKSDPGLLRLLIGLSEMPSTNDFRTELAAQIARAAKQGRSHVEINAGELHRAVGGYPPQAGEYHSMPTCCKVMRDEFERGKAEIIYKTESSNAPALTIRYYLPR
jgi:5-methylcytosine-specific restriction protein A